MQPLSRDQTYYQYVSKYKILGKYLQPFTRYSRKEKPEVPKCQMLAANILKADDFTMESGSEMSYV